MAKLDDWLRSGLYDPEADEAEDRLALLKFLDEQDFSIDEMRDADVRGRLFGLAGDRLLRVGPIKHRICDLADALGRDIEVVRDVWRALGFEYSDDPEALLATDNDVRALRTALVLVEILGRDPARSLMRTYGTSMRHIADAESAAFRAVSQVSVRRSGSELTTAKSWFELMHFFADVGHLLDVVHRHHVDASRRHFEASGTETDLADSEREVRLGIAFVDLSGFTALSQTLAPSELSSLLERFERTTHTLAAACDCRVVKFIGDAAMIVSPDADVLAHLADEIVRAFTEPTPARVGVAFGDVVAREGDYFGGAVNLAARLIAAAPPATVVTTASLAQRLGPGWECRSSRSHEFRGLDEPVEVLHISR